MRRRDLRQLRRDAARRDYLALEPEPREDEHDGYSNVREREPIPMRDGVPAIDPRAPWPTPTNREHPTC